MLKQNTTINAQYPRRMMGGGVSSGARIMFGRSEVANQYSSLGITDRTAATPSGHLAPSSWILPLRAGGMSSRNEAAATLAPTGTAAQGMNISSSVVLNLTTSAAGKAIASGSGSASVALSVSGNANAPINATGSATLVLTASCSPSGIAEVSGSGSLSLTASLVTGAIGHMVSEPISQALTADIIASAVWSALASANNEAGTMGNKLNNAAAGGVDYDALAQAVWEYLDRTLTASDCPTANDVAQAIILAAQTTAIEANIKYVNDVSVIGDGSDNNPWNPS